jgi:dihydroneopterin aldolase
MDRILIEAAVFRVYVGVTAEERNRRQEIVLDLQVFTDTRPAGTSDDLRLGVSYVDIHAAIRGVITNKEYNLIEAIAEDAAAVLMARFPVLQGAVVKVAKPAALSDRAVRSAAVEITRMRNG